ncbi:MAG: GNAT family N-acetyltransferase [Chloroflexi bacterium]|nr:GNAT family N-acetyltransferase [Chloroflexota bacterium]
MNFEQRKDNFLISTDPSKIDLDAVHAYLVRSYWAEGIPREVVERSIKGSLCFGVYMESEVSDFGQRQETLHSKPLKQIGFARVITDRATYAYIGDLYILEEYRGKGLSKWLMSCIKAHPDLQDLRRWALATRDAHGLYKQFGFAELKAPERWMEITNPGIYKKTG